MRNNAKRMNSEILRSYVRLILEGAVPDDSPAQAQEKPTAESESSEQKLRSRIADVLDFANGLDSTILKAFQADVDIPFVDDGPSQKSIEQKVTDLIVDAANKDSKYAGDFPLCTAVILAAIDEGDLQNGPAMLRDIYETAKSRKSVKKESFSSSSRKRLIKESAFGEITERYLKTVLESVIETLVKKRLVTLGTEIEIEKFVREVAAGKLKLPAGAMLSGAEEEAGKVIKELVVGAVELNKIEGATKDLDIVKRVVRSLSQQDPAVINVANKVDEFAKASRYSLNTGTVDEPIDDALQTFNRLQPDQQLDVVQDAGLANVDEFRQAAAQIRNDVAQLSSFAENAVKRPEVLRSAIKTASRSAKLMAKKALIFGWDVIAGSLSAIKETFFPPGSATKWMKVIAAATSIGTLWQLVDEDPVLRADYLTRLRLADRMAVDSYKQWADSANFDEIADEMETVFDPANSSLDSAITIVRSFEEVRSAATGATVTVAE